MWLGLMYDGLKELGIGYVYYQCYVGLLRCPVSGIDVVQDLPARKLSSSCMAFGAVCLQKVATMGIQTVDDRCANKMRFICSLTDRLQALQWWAVFTCRKNTSKVRYWIIMSL